MSYIDAFDHELVAFFAGLPLYHPLQEISGGVGRPDEFASSPDELILGGGEGEHPAAVLRDPSGAVCHFLQTAITLVGSELPEREQSLLDNAPDFQRCLAFPGWGLEDIAAFVARCNSPAFVMPYRREHPYRDGPLERWLVSNLGEFVYFAMPELAAETIAMLPETRKLVQAPVFYNVLILPPGYRVQAGRHHDSAGNIIWGNYPWITTRKHQNIE